MTDWRSRWHAVVASDVSARDGLGWEFTSPGGDPAWAVVREDGGPFPVFSSARRDVMPGRDDLQAMTREAVADLLAAVGLADEIGWITDNIVAALLLASTEVISWEGEEWAVESDSDDHPIAWADPDAARTPYAWLRAKGVEVDSVISSYQDDAVFGLCFLPPSEIPRFPQADVGSLRSRRDIHLARGRVNQVELVYDTTVEGGLVPGLVTEALLHGDSGPTLLIAAAAYTRDEWHLFDESVVAVTDPAAANTMDWVPPRRRWLPTEGPRS